MFRSVPGSSPISDDIRFQLFAWSLELLIFRGFGMRAVHFVHAKCSRDTLLHVGSTATAVCLTVMPEHPLSAHTTPRSDGHLIPSHSLKPIHAISVTNGD